MTIDGFESIHLYSLMCHLLKLQPAPNNGSLGVLFPTLVESDKTAVTWERTVIRLIAAAVAMNVALWIAFRRRTVHHLE